MSAEISEAKTPIEAAIAKLGVPLVVITHRQLLELYDWQNFGRRLAPLLTRVLAAQGDTPDRDHVDLQHKLTELLQPSAEFQPQHGEKAT